MSGRRERTLLPGRKGSSERTLLPFRPGAPATVNILATNSQNSTHMTNPEVTAYSPPIVNKRSDYNKSLREGSNTGGKLRRKTKKYHKKSKKRVRKCKKCRGTQKRR